MSLPPFSQRRGCVKSSSNRSLVLNQEHLSLDISLQDGVQLLSRLLLVGISQRDVKQIHLRRTRLENVDRHGQTRLFEDIDGVHGAGIRRSNATRSIALRKIGHAYMSTLGAS